ncbi:MAG TPA: hypothetical protein VGZ89_16050 [Xanthobacteraceae bacterium]|jgi:hypothetical protein|nr:hypothetical protein [Xanthobacteraceae bacterium]
MEAFWDAAAHDLDLGVAIPLALQISFNCPDVLVQYRLTAQFHHMANG